jgi:membrane-associated phospholipid phosphatase
MHLWLALADTRALLWLNHALARAPRLYASAVFLTDKGADVATLATVAWLWFWFEPRRESRARLIVFAAVAMAAYVTARIIAFAIDVDRPFATYLAVRGNPGSFDGLRTYGSFPSDHAALLGALPLALFYWDRYAAWSWTALAAVLAVARVAVGFHYPGDMVAGAAIGAVFAAAAMIAYERNVQLRGAANWIASGFDRAPQSYALYGLAGLVTLEFAMHFKHVLAVLFTLRYVIGGHWGVS